jgi:hypothetical protein
VSARVGSGPWGLLAAAAVMGATPGAIAAPAKGTFRVTNDAPRVVECVLLVEGHTRTYLKIHPGKAYFDDFGPRELLQLVCMRGEEGAYGPLKVGTDYRIVMRGGNHVDVDVVVAGAD